MSKPPDVTISDRRPTAPGASRAYPRPVAHYLFNVSHHGPARGSAREQAEALLGVRMWGVDADEQHRDELSAGDLALIYLPAPERTFTGHVELATSAHVWTSSEAETYPGESTSGVQLSTVEHWAPPVPMDAVLERIDRSENARGDFEMAVVRITQHEYETALAVHAERSATS